MASPDGMLNKKKGTRSVRQGTCLPRLNGEVRGGGGREETSGRGRGGGSVKKKKARYRRGAVK